MSKLEHSYKSKGTGDIAKPLKTNGDSPTTIGGSGRDASSTNHQPTQHPRDRCVDRDASSNLSSYSKGYP